VWLLRQVVVDAEFVVRNSWLDGGGSTEPVAAAAPRRPAGLLLARLRQATLESHKRVDLAVSKLRLEDAADYGAFLNLHYSVLQLLKPNWRSEDDADFRCFAVCLDEDLRAIGVARPKLPLGSPALASPPGKLGLAYVIRGSRLGSKLLRQRVAANFATSYFDCPVTVAWPVFLRQLDELPEAVAPMAEAEVIEGAQQTFELFLQLIGRWPMRPSQ
jgi:heme oxygenase (biliverdin-IX-beta and delta-forming)